MFLYTVSLIACEFMTRAVSMFTSVSTYLLKLNFLDIRLYIQVCDNAQHGKSDFCDTVQWTEIPIALVWFLAVPEAERSHCVEAGKPIKLQCEISDSVNQTCWLKDGKKLLPKSGINIDSEGNKMSLAIKSTTSSCSGVYSCKTDDHSEFNDFCVEVKGDTKGDIFLARCCHCKVILSWP